ncbi:MAG: hypothetical protein JNM90_24495, partial [Burkholderiales bacterium]|nr:hypothetical protein [Burkholderiales bacterium]
LFGWEGSDILDGGEGDDSLNGGVGGDVLSGGNGNDNINGGKGFDNLDGGEGNDTLNGALGADLLTGGNGADRFVFSTALDGVVNVDTIADFTGGVDRIALSAAIFGAFAGQVGQTIGLSDQLTYNATTGVLAYDADGAGNGAAVNFAILGASVHPGSVGSDFLIVA